MKVEELVKELRKRDGMGHAADWLEALENVRFHAQRHLTFEIPGTKMHLEEALARLAELEGK